MPPYRVMRAPPQKAVAQPPATDPPRRQRPPGGKAAALHLHEVDRLVVARRAGLHRGGLHLGVLQGNSIFVQNSGRTGSYMAATAFSRVRTPRRCRVIHACVFAACMTSLVSSAPAQVPEVQLVSSVSSDTYLIDGFGNSTPEAMLLSSPGMSVDVSSIGVASKPAMIAAAAPVTTTSEVCLERIPAANVVQPADGAPNAPSAYAPLTAHCKLQLFLRRAYSPYTFASAAFEAGIAQMSAEWPQYGGGMQGWGKRYGATLADTESRRFIQTYLLSTVLHQDPRYFPSTSTSLMGRAWYAATRVLVTRGDNGRSQFNTSEMLGALSTSALQNVYYPRHYRTLDDTISRFTGALSSDATSAILREFTPDLKRLFNKHCPRKVKRFEERLPIPEEDKF